MQSKNNNRYAGLYENLIQTLSKLNEKQFIERDTLIIMILVMAPYHYGLIKIAIFLAACTIVVAALPRLSPVIYPAVPEPSEEFDCDDSTLHMYQHFQQLGIESVPVMGNLNFSGEKFMESDHVWLMVKSGDNVIAYDWGEPRFDRQHYEGYQVSLNMLLYAVAEDKNDTTIPVVAGY